MRIGAIDIGSNSTRLLVAETNGSEIREFERCSIVTRLGSGVDESGQLTEEAQERVFDVLHDYRAVVEKFECERLTGVMTSAVRDSQNGGAFNEKVRQFIPAARIIDGEEEARLTFLGATSERALDLPTAIIDIGGGSTEFVIGTGDEISFHTSLQTGVVRQTERHLSGIDPATSTAVTDLRTEVAETIREAIPVDVRSAVSLGIAVAGTATSAAAIDQQLDPYDPSKVHGYVLKRPTVVAILERLTPLTHDERKDVSGLHPDRALTIVAGVAILLEAMDALGLSEIEVSEHDILRGMVIEASRG